FPERLALAASFGAISLNYEECDVYEALMEMTQGDGPDSCIDAVGMEAHGHSFDAFVDNVKTSIKLQMDRAHALRQAIHSCRKNGTVSIPGVYLGFIDKFNFGQAFNKGLKFRMGQTNTQIYMQPLLKRILEGEI